MLLVVVATGAGADSVKVRIEGLDDPMRDNVRLLLTIARLEDEKDVTEARIRQADADAPEEIATALQPFGYYRPEVRPSLQRNGTRWTATYRVTPGPPLRLTTVDVAVEGPGARDEGFRTGVASFPLDEGDVLVHPVYETGKQAFVDYASAHGYLDAEFSAATVRVDTEVYRADLRLRFRTGPQFVFGPVRMHQDILDPKVLRGYVNFEQGEPLDLDKLLVLQNALSGSPYFSRVEVLAQREQARGVAVPIDVNLVPAARQRWQVGAGYGTDTGPRGRVDYELRRINRQGHRGEGQVIASGIEKSLEARYVIPGPYPRTDTLTFALGYADVRPKTNVQQTGLLGVRQTRSLGAWRQSIGLSYQRERYEVGLDRGVSQLILPEVSWSRTESDDRVFPTHGRRVEVRLRGARRGFVSDATFLQVYALAKHVRTLARDVRLIARAEAGHIETSTFRLLPPSSRFFAGGDQSIRGFSYQGVGDLDEAGNIIGGTRLFTVSLEADWLFFEKFGRWGAAVFYDAGSAGRSMSALDRRGAGAGLRWLSPIGMVRADFAVAVSEPGRPKRFHLTIGPDL